MDDEHLDPQLRDLARAHHQPPETPREAMWAAIRQARPVVARPRHWWRTPWVPLGAAAAAVLAIGVGIGRLTSDGESAPAVASEPAAAGDASPAAAYRLATLEHLSQSEEFLTLFRSAVTRGGDQRLASATARRLLAGNRLLLDSPAAADRRTRLLLEDLELVLAGIAQLSPGAPAQDLELIREGMDRGDVMPRLRTAVPAGAVPTQGAL